LIPTVVINLAPHFEVVNEMFEDDDEEDKQRECSLNLLLWLRTTAAAVMPSTPIRQRSPKSAGRKL
jgi:hypothetical protein